MKQNPDRLQRQDHVEEHIGRLDHAKARGCPHPRTQYAEALELEHELRFQLQNVHCVELREGLTRSSLESKANTKPQKRKISNEACHHTINLEPIFRIEKAYKFVGKTAKLWMPTTSLINSKVSTLSPFSDVDTIQSGSDTPPSSDTPIQLLKIRQAAITMHGSSCAAKTMG